MIALHRILHRHCDTDAAWWRGERARVEGERDLAKARCKELHGDLLTKNVQLAHRVEQAEAALAEALNQPPGADRPANAEGGA